MEFIFILVAVGALLYIVYQLGKALKALHEVNSYLRQHHPRYVGAGRWMMLALLCAFLTADFHYFCLGFVVFAVLKAIQLIKESRSIPKHIFDKQARALGTIGSILLAVVVFVLRRYLRDARGSQGGGRPESVDGHFREGTWVDSYTKTDGTSVTGHFRSDSWVDPHRRG